MGTDMYFGDGRSHCAITVAEQDAFLAKEGKTLAAYCSDMGWECDIDANGVVISISTESSRFTSADNFFKGIAPYVMSKKAEFWYEDEEKEQGSFVIENGELRHKMLDRWMVDWEDPPAELLKQLIRAHIEHADADSVRRLVDETIAATVMEA